MKIRYNELMLNICVTDQMRDRILNNINHLNLEKPPRKTILRFNYKRTLSIASSIVILFIGIFFIYNKIHLESDPPVQVAPDIVSYPSAEELSKTVGFTAKEIQNTPFVIDSVNYTSDWKELVEIEYIGLQNTVVFRMANGDKDISGYFEDFSTVKAITLNDCEISLKGFDDKYLLAVWQTEGYSYSVQFTKPVSEQEFINTIQSIK